MDNIINLQLLSRKGILLQLTFLFEIKSFSIRIQVIIYFKQYPHPNYIQMIHSQMEYMKLRQKQLHRRKNFKQKTTIMKIRMIYLENSEFYYYPEQNFLVCKHEVKFYSFKGNVIEENTIITKKFNEQHTNFKITLFLENDIVLYHDDHTISVKANDFSNFHMLDHKIRYLSFLRRLGQINKQQFCLQETFNFPKPLLIHNIRNFKKSHSINKANIHALKYHRHIVQAQAWSQHFQFFYYYTSKMTKQIRKCKVKESFESIFNSNYLFVHIFGGSYWNQIKIYDISSMKIKGIIELSDKQEFHQCLFIEDLNIIAVMYSGRLELLDFNTLKCVGHEKIDLGYEQVIKYDKQNGLTIFLICIEMDES